MATLKTSRHSSAFTARSRLNQVIHEHAAPMRPTPEPVRLETISTISETAPAASSNTAPKEASAANNYRQYLSEMDQHHLLLQTVKVYDGWHLVSIQHRPENGGIVAHLVRNNDQGDPSLAIREGRALQIIMDALGDMQIHHARRRRVSFWRRLFGGFTTAFAPQF